MNEFMNDFNKSKTRCELTPWWHYVESRKLSLILPLQAESINLKYLLHPIQKLDLYRPSRLYIVSLLFALPHPTIGRTSTYHFSAHDFQIAPKQKFPANFPSMLNELSLKAEYSSET
ncbi:hypothetical protein RRG08_001540 [Elysia crispata]|uniref:Uncharacterized protein n=1 Tax=Elysia crispata TaxID=231223 RepID=A0AAE1AL62_9GAST|nr:hypothetical protein RRG08_001540 [Elysia crispata]